jgi:hypothetical protein
MVTTFENDYEKLLCILLYSQLSVSANGMRIYDDNYVNYNQSIHQADSNYRARFGWHDRALLHAKCYGASNIIGGAWPNWMNIFYSYSCDLLTASSLVAGELYQFMIDFHIKGIIGSTGWSTNPFEPIGTELTKCSMFFSIEGADLDAQGRTIRNHFTQNSRIFFERVRREPGSDYPHSGEPVDTTTSTFSYPFTPSNNAIYTVFDILLRIELKALNKECLIELGNLTDMRNSLMVELNPRVQRVLSQDDPCYCILKC